jgi:hypothetical protein
VRTSLLSVAALAACAPRWIDPSYQPRAVVEAIRTAARDHHCPVEQVALRCDATRMLGVLDGDFVVYDDGGAVGTIVDEVPAWEFELDVCHHLRRYGLVQGRIAERVPVCTGAVCLDASPSCRSTARGGWWAVEAASAPERCDDAAVDDRLSVDLDDRYVRVTAVSDGRPRASCTDPSFMVSIDGRWYTLCGDPATTPPRGEAIQIVSGLMLGAGPHEIYAAELAAFDDAWPSCRRSRARAVDVVVPVAWHDI